MGNPLPLRSLSLMLLAALLTALISAAPILPSLAFVLFILLLPAPILTTWVYLALGSRWAVASGGLAVLLALVIGGASGLAAAAVALLCVLGGLALGAALQERATPILSGVMVAVALAIGTLAVLMLLRLTGGDLLTMLRQGAGDALQSFSLGAVMPGDRLSTLQQDFPRLVIYYFPANLVLTSAAWALVLYLVARWTLGRRYDVPPVQPFAEWRYPGWVPWLFVPGLLLWLIGLRPAAGGTARLGDNYLQVMNFLFEVQGLAVVFWWFRKRLGRLLSGTFTAMLALVQPAALLLMFLGLWDAIFDFRKLEPRPER